MHSEAENWRPCSSCKSPISYAQSYWVCNVSTCNRARTALHFCSVSCWDAHLPIARHRESWAEERHAPAQREAAQPKERPAKRIIASRAPAPSAPPAAPATPAALEETLIVASRLKEFVRAESGFNTSDRVLGPLSDIVRRISRRAIANARRAGRKTVLDRDVPKS